MKKLFSFALLSFVLSIIFFSCNKDDTVSTGNGNNNTGNVTQTFNSNPNLNKTISNSGPVFDTINVIITDNILTNKISEVKISLRDVSNVEVDKIKFSLIHGSTEVAIIDVLTKTGTGNFTNTVLWDQATTLIDSGQSPYTGTFKPQNPLSSFNNSDPAGNWIIKITYTGNIKTGVIKSWGITLTYMPVAPPANVLMPLAVGNNWTVEVRDTSGNFIENKTVSVPYSTTISGKTVYRWNLSWNPDTIYLWNESDGVWMHRIKNGTGGSGLGWKYPVNQGEWWLTGNDTSFCLSTNETVVTPSGTYTGCIKYKFPDKYNNQPSFAYHYMKPGLGMVRFDYYDNFNQLHEIWKLISYHINP